MKSLLFILCTLFLATTLLAKELQYTKLIQTIELKKQRNIIKAQNAAQILKFSVSPSAPKVKENVTLFIQPITSFIDSNMILEVQFDGTTLTTDLEHPTADMWIYNAGSFTEIKSHSLQAKIFIQDKNAAQLLINAITQIDSQITALNAQIANTTDPQTIAQLVAQRDDKIAQKNDLSQTLANLKTEIATENFSFQVKEDLSQNDYPKITSLTPNVIKANVARQIQISGQNFDSTTQVKVNNQVVSITNQTPTVLTVNVPALGQGLYDMEVMNTDNGQIKNAIMKGALFVTTEDLANPNILPTAVITALNPQIALGTQAQLSAANSFDANNKPLRYEWKFISTPQNSDQQVTNWPIHQTAQFNFTPNVPGFYVVELKAIQTQAPNLVSQPSYMALEVQAPSNRTPVVAAFTLPVLINTTTQRQITVNDPDFWQSQSFYITKTTNLGTATVTSTGTLQFQAGASAGSDTIQILVVDSGTPAQSTTVTINISVVASNQSPTMTGVFTQNRTQGLPIRSLIAPQGVADADGSIKEIKIDCGDGTIEYAPVSGPNFGIVIHNYHNYGTYNGVVYVKDNLGAVTTYNFTNNVLNTDVPNLKFSMNQFSCASAPCSITADATASSDSDGINQYRWLWGDNTAEDIGGASTHKVRTHTYNNVGTYRLRLRLRDVNQAQSEGYATVYVGTPAPNAGSPASGMFTAVPNREVQISTNITLDGSLSFDPNPNGSITNITWNMNCWPTNTCSSSASGATYTGQYQSALNYYPEMNITNASGGVTTTYPMEVFATTQGHAPKAVMKVNNQVILGTDVIGVAPLTLNLDSTNSFDYDGSIATTAWDFGDGTFNYNNQVQVTKTFSSPGIYFVRLTVKDNDNNNHSITQKVIVNSARKRTSIEGSGNSKINFISSLDTPEENLTNACGLGQVKACAELKSRYQKAGR